MRWQHPEEGMISPGDFIPLFEKTGIYAGLTAMCLRKCAER